MNQKLDKQSIIWGGLLVLVGGMMLIQTFTEIGTWVWAAVMGGVGLAVYAVYAIERKAKWMLIVSYIFLVIALMLALLELEVLGDAWVATYVLGSIALPFLYVYLSTGRTQWWFLIPAYSLIAIGIMVPLLEAEILTDEIVPAYVFLTIALPFFVAYIRNRKLWWALIPGAIMGIMGLGFLVSSIEADYVLPVALIILGLGVFIGPILRGKSDAEADTEVEG